MYYLNALLPHFKYTGLGILGETKPLTISVEILVLVYLIKNYNSILISTRISVITELPTCIIAMKS